MNAKLAKTIVSAVSSVGFSIVLGYTYKLSKMVNERIDEHYAESENEPKADQDN